MNDELTESFAYLLGLITGRGHIFDKNGIIAIEFSHANEIAKGIAHCPKCGYFATKVGDKLKCKNPTESHVVDESVKKTYNQPESTKNSLVETIIPFLTKDIKAKYEITGNRSMTLLVIDFNDNRSIFETIKKHFSPDSSFDSFHIPRIIYTSSQECKVEFVNGLLDTSGFPSPGGWLNRDGEKGHGRMRVYFQIVRNWHLPVEIDNFLRSEFNLPIHTIDWGHPNIRDANLEDFFNSNPTSWSREHQIKFFPEYYGMFSFRITSKQALFKELYDHNIKTVFTNKDDWFPPVKITSGKIKAYHPGEADLRLPEPVRRHFDAFWQVNFAMGCRFLLDLKSKAKMPEIFKLTGDVNYDGNINDLENTFEIIRKRLEKEAFDKEKTKERIEPKILLRTHGTEEKQTYEPLTVFLKEYLFKKYSEPIETFDTSSGNLNLFLKNKNAQLLEVFDYCEKYRIRPDIVGFLTHSKKIVFIESKVTPLDLKALGQLIGYCMVAQPEEAILISTKTPSISFIKIIKARPDLLNYTFDKKIKIANLTNGSVNFINI